MRGKESSWVGAHSSEVEEDAFFHLPVTRGEREREKTKKLMRPLRPPPPPLLLSLLSPLETAAFLISVHHHPYSSSTSSFLLFNITETQEGGEGRKARDVIMSAVTSCLSFLLPPPGTTPPFLFFPFFCFVSLAHVKVPLRVYELPLRVHSAPLCTRHTLPHIDQSGKVAHVRENGGGGGGGGVRGEEGKRVSFTEKRLLNGRKKFPPQHPTSPSELILRPVF